ncbi:hypothetical protein [Psychroserpens mesophilus]|uniref:hypothetical protein n=1 Tax=Psychroserpens mesophilus TaxID=325473 RepID=UPI000A60052F|nr:hypothetical protein [Psychroserpens mesophilus]
MKYLIYAFSLLMVTGAYAQNKPVDKVEETKTKTIKVNKDGKIVENKVKVTTSKTQEVMTTPKDSSTINNQRVFPKVKVTKTISVDNDNDPFYDTTDKVIYYTDENGKYLFTSNKKGFTMSDAESNDIGFAARSTNNEYYILTMDNYSGVGYFNEAGNFVVEYYNADLEMLVTKEFKSDTKF